MQQYSDYIWFHNLSAKNLVVKLPPDLVLTATRIGWSFQHHTEVALRNNLIDYDSVCWNFSRKLINLSLVVKVVLNKTGAKTGEKEVSQCRPGEEGSEL
jgi:hypothetical protein